METTRQSNERQVAVLIDTENVGMGPMPWLFDQISDVGRIIVRRAYADWSGTVVKRDQLLEMGIELIEVFRSASSGKNSSDIRLVIDAIDLLYQSPVDTFVVVSSDSDFVPLVSKLRAAGREVIGAGRKATASRTLVRSCDRYIYLDQGEKMVAPTGQVAQRSTGDGLLVRAVRAAMDEQGQVTGARLHRTLMRLDPSFDFRALGYSTFTKFLESAKEVRVVRPRGPGDVAVELAENSGGGIRPQPQPIREVPRVERVEHVEPTPAPSPAPSPMPTRPIDVQSQWTKIDAAWSNSAARRQGQSIPGPIAAAGAAKVLGVSKLSSSPYRTIQSLLDASELLRSNWVRDGNTIMRKQAGVSTT